MSRPWPIVAYQAIRGHELKSTLAWLDHSEVQRRKMMEVVSLFKEKTTVDNLGLGSIRDTFSELLFPGTTVLFTRARYLLFVPWLCQLMELERTPSHRARERLRRLEIELIFALIDGEDASTTGIIGRDARANLKQFPSTMYWGGLRRFGILTAPVTLDQYTANLDAFHRAVRAAVRDDEAETETTIHNWHLGMPAAPQGLLESVTLALTAEEAGFLTDRLVTSAPGSLTAAMLQSTTVTEVPLPWAHPAVDDLLAETARVVDHARRFSDLLHGASLLYNLRLAQEVRRRRTTASDVALDVDLVDAYLEQCSDWADAMQAPGNDLTDWDRVDFWGLVHRFNPRVPTSTQRFVDRWRELVAAHGPADVVHQPGAHDLVRVREFQLKGNLARLSNPRALERWSGATNVGQLDYRWGTVQGIVNEIITAREPARA